MGLLALAEPCAPQHAMALTAPVTSLMVSLLSQLVPFLTRAETNTVLFSASLMTTAMRMAVPLVPRQFQGSLAFACIQQPRTEFPCSWRPPSWYEHLLGAPAVALASQAYSMPIYPAGPPYPLHQRERLSWSTKSAWCRFAWGIYDVEAALWRLHKGFFPFTVRVNVYVL